MVNGSPEYCEFNQGKDDVGKETHLHMLINRFVDPAKDGCESAWEQFVQIMQDDKDCLQNENFNQNWHQNMPPWIKQQLIS